MHDFVMRGALLLAPAGLPSLTSALRPFGIGVRASEPMSAPGSRAAGVALSPPPSPPSGHRPRSRRKPALVIG